MSDLSILLLSSLRSCANETVPNLRVTLTGQFEQVLEEDFLFMVIKRHVQKH